MTKGRLEAFSDAVIAIAITIMVLELRAPHSGDWAALKPLVPALLIYTLSFAFLGIYWNNHHHMMHAADRVNGTILWANLHLLFWLSLVPFVTAWMAEHPDPAPVAAYGVVMLCSAVAYTLLQVAIVRHHGPDSRLAAALGKDHKARVSLGLYVAAIPLAYVDRRIAIAVFALVALLWIVPDRRIERQLGR
jgi:uncharacterized membrane protein